MAEFARVQLVMGKDLTQSLIALQLELENSSQAFLSDVSKVLNLQPTDLVAHEVKVSSGPHHKSAPTSVGAASSSGRTGGLPPAMPPRNRLSNRDLGTHGKAHWEDDSSCQPGSGASQHT